MPAESHPWGKHQLPPPREALCRTATAALCGNTRIWAFSSASWQRQSCFCQNCWQENIGLEIPALAGGVQRKQLHGEFGIFKVSSPTARDQPGAPWGCHPLADGDPHPGTFFPPNPEAGPRSAVVQGRRCSHPVHGEDAEPEAKDDVSKRSGTGAVKTMSPTRLSPASRYRPRTRWRGRGYRSLFLAKATLLHHFAFCSSFLCCSRLSGPETSAAGAGAEAPPFPLCCQASAERGRDWGPPGHRRGHFGFKSSVFCPGEQLGPTSSDVRDAGGVMPQWGDAVGGLCTRPQNRERHFQAPPPRLCDGI